MLMRLKASIARLMPMPSRAVEGVRRLRDRRSRDTPRLSRTIEVLEAGRNPLDRTFIDPARPDFLDRCRGLADALVARGGGGRARSWDDDGAALVLTGLIAFVAACEPDGRLRNLSTVRRLLRSPRAYARAVDGMQQVRGFGGVVALLGRLLEWLDIPGPGPAMIAALRRTAWLDDPPAAPAAADDLTP